MSSRALSPERRGLIKVTYAGKKRTHALVDDDSASVTSSESARSKANPRVSSSRRDEKPRSTVSKEFRLQGKERAEAFNLPGPRPLPKRSQSRGPPTPKRVNHRKSLSAFVTSGAPTSPGKTSQRSRRLTEGTKRSKALADLGAEDDASSVAPSMSASETVSVTDSNAVGGRRTLEERKQILEQDPLVGEIKPSDAYCTPCQKWIRLSSGTQYALKNWRSHLARMHGKMDSLPSRRVQEANRKLQLVNDPDVVEFSSDKVLCKTCQQTVRLSDKIPFDLISWLDHKAECKLSHSSAVDHVGHQDGLSLPTTSAIGWTPDVDDFESLDVPSPEVTAMGPEVDLTAYRPPPSASSASTHSQSNIDLVPVVLAGQKHARDGDDAKDENERGSPRPRRASYTSLQEDVPAREDASAQAAVPELKNLFWLPWQTFKKGFSEGIFSSSS